MVKTETANVRFGTEEDLALCLGFENLPAHLPAKKIIASKLAQNEIVVAELSSKIVGYLRLEYLWSEYPYISLIKVDEAYRAKGIGRTMIAFLKDYLVSQGYDRLFSSSQVDEPRAQAWHRGTGFAECGIVAGLNSGGIGEVFFCKKLS